MIVSYKYRIKNRSAYKALQAHAYAVNQVWNWCVAYQRDIKDRYQAGAPKRKWPKNFDLVRQCNGVGAELGIHQHTVQEVCKQFAQSLEQNSSCPRFRSSFGVGRSRGWVPFQKQSRQLSGNSITYLGKKYRFWEGGRPVPENAKGGAFTEEVGGKWYVYFYVEVEKRVPSSDVKIGIDLGLKTLAALSNGHKIPSPRFFRSFEKKLGAAQRAKNKKKIATIYAKIKNSRKDFLHKITTKLAREYAFIAVGNVKSKQLAKTNMAKSMYDAGWFTFRDMLKYKSLGYIEVDESFTTQTCSCCGSVESSERPRGIAGLSKRVWECSKCGASHDRDVNAARNILARALSTQRPVGESQQRALAGATG